MEIEIYNMKIVRFDSLTKEEVKNISCQPVMLWTEPGTDYHYLAELPLKYNGDASKNMCYLFDGLSDEEKKLFEDRAETIPLTRKEVTQVYPKKKVRK